jgi:hypothetical protein
VLLKGIAPSHHSLPCSLDTGFHVRLPVIRTLENPPPLIHRVKTSASGTMNVCSDLGYLVLCRALVYPYALKRIGTHPFRENPIHGAPS